MSKNKTNTLLDPYQIQVKTFQEETDSLRVTLVEGGQFIKIPECIIEKKIQTIEVPTIIKQLEIKEIVKEIPIIITKIEKVQEIVKQVEKIEIPTIVKEYEKIYIPVPIKEIQIKEIIKEVPIIQTQIERIEIPKIVKEIEIKDISIWIKIAIVGQFLIPLIHLLIGK